MIKIIIGPTASGKSALAVERALDDNGVIINADAMQCYDALPILTAQPTHEERAGIPHHLYAVLTANDKMSAPDWVAMAAEKIRDAYECNKTPYLVGGTGFYIKAMMEGLSPLPEVPSEIRQNLETRLSDEGLPSLYTDLETRDPVMAERLKSGDTQRIIRALEVLDYTGESLSTWQEKPLEKPADDWAFHVIQMRPPKPVLEEKIVARLNVMVKAGMMDEVQILSDRIDCGDVDEKAPVTIAHGFRLLRQVLKGTMGMDAALERTAIETRQYVKRQMTWLRNQIRADELIE